jgi:hypothetical protein
MTRATFREAWDTTNKELDQKQSHVVNLVLRCNMFFVPPQGETEKSGSFDSSACVDGLLADRSGLRRMQKMLYLKSGDERLELKDVRNCK